MFLCIDNTVANLLSYVPGDVGNKMETARATLSDPDAEHMAERSLSDPDAEHMAERSLSNPDAEHMAERSLSNPDAEHMAEHTVAGNTTGESLDTGRRNHSYTHSFSCVLYFSFVLISIRPTYG